MGVVAPKYVFSTEADWTTQWCRLGSIVKYGGSTSTIAGSNITWSTTNATTTHTFNAVEHVHVWQDYEEDCEGESCACGGNHPFLGCSDDLCPDVIWVDLVDEVDPRDEVMPTINWPPF